MRILRRPWDGDEEEKSRKNGDQSSCCAYLATFIGPTGKILSRRRTGFTGQNQRKLTKAVKLARFMALLPFVGSAAEYRPPRRD